MSRILHGLVSRQGFGSTALRSIWPRMAVFAITAAVSLSGAADFLEFRLSDARFRLLPREASGQVVVVAIDGLSIQRLGYWPWPRGLHAELLDRLREAGAADVSLDIDFSSRSNPREDALLEAALERWSGDVALPAFKQPTLVPGQFVYSEPLPRFRRQVGLGSVNVRPDSDGALRRLATQTRAADGSPLPALAARLAGAAAGDLPPIFYMDYGIRPDTVPQISYSAILAGDFDPDIVAGRHVIVGATAIELGDIVAVPVWRAMPGALVQAVAAESILQGRMLRPLPQAITLGLAAVLILVLSFALERLSWRVGLVVVAATLIGCNVISLLVQATLPVLPAVLPVSIATILTYAVAVFGRMDQQSFRLLAQRLALDRQGRLMRAIVDNTFDALVTTDSAGRIRSFNPAAERLFGRSAADVRGRPFRMLLQAESTGPEGDAGGSLLGGIAGSGEPREMQAVHANGNSFEIDLAVTRTDDELAAFYIALVRDIGTRKAAEREAAQSRHRLLDAIESLSEGFALYDSDDRLMLCNEKYRAIFPGAADLLCPGWLFDDIMRAYAAMLGPADGVEQPSEWAEEMVRHHNDPKGVYEIRGAGGRWLQLGERRTHDGGVAVIVSDITELKLREAELRRARDEAELANRSKSEFLANMSHELRTPLNAVIGFAEMMEAQLFGPLGHDNYRTYAKDIRSSGEHLLAVINDILDMARIEAGKIALNEEMVDLAAIAETAARLIAQRAESAGLRLALALDRDVPLVFADARLVKQCLVNLLSNAVKFTPGGGRIEVRTADTPEGLVLEVADTGIGIAPADMEQVLAPFGQAYGALDRRYEGTGLGLPLVKSYMELHGGELRLESAPGKGTRAVLIFPPERRRGVERARAATGR